ncbi:MAG: hypothetical protein R2822_15940 [Spirosomataceae bacterium]
MKNNIHYFLLATFCLFLVACGDKKDPLMEEAGKIHLEAMAIEEGLHEQIEGIDSLKVALDEKRKTITDAAATASLDSTVAMLDAVANSFETWEENLVEVPGLAHEHHHHEGEEHHHDHKPAPNVSSEQMVEIQKEIKANIEKIKSEMAKAEEMLKRVL